MSRRPRVPSVTVAAVVTDCAIGVVIRNNNEKPLMRMLSSVLDRNEDN
jgi:hypothetical protein